MVTRRIDDLGRIVIPKEMRRRLGINEGDALSIEVKENEIVLREYDCSWGTEIKRLKDGILFDKGKN